ncbi:2-oxo-4-hydroxy-4-carboxy-5-ureidoimidazoline decarboxylase [Streptomyces sp. NPDC093085]|uniref:2-oxo-4-hydroxy-4-carboxy-5-ureidoimidazoline decarboxylase n=1 Tax=Streptomyces sp. NPDC093085 TaxID=3155068 RepID=UPI003445BEC3
MTTSPARPVPGLERFNTAPDTAALAALREVCAAPGWGRAVLAGRPYATEDALFAAGDTATARLTGAELTEALAGHPRIGRPDPGDARSAREQRGMAGAGARLRADMAELNAAYEERFGHVFLICATGATAEEMRDALLTRLGHPPDREREVARTELGKINRIRLAGLLAEGGEYGEGAEYAEDPAAAESFCTVSTHILDTSAGRPAAGVAVTLSVRTDGDDSEWSVIGGSVTDADGRCTGLPAPPPGTAHVRLAFATGPYLAHRDGGAPFFPEVTAAFAVDPGEHYHVPLLLNPFGYSVYRGS